MEIERHGEIHHSSNMGDQNVKKTKRRKLLVLLVNILFLVIGTAGTPLLLRLYFIHGGNRKWFTAFLQTAGFPFLLLPLLISLFQRRKVSRNSSSSGKPKLLLITPPLLLCSTLIGLITGIDDFFYSYGIACLPASTASLLASTQLGFTSLFAFFIVGQRFGGPTINAVVLLTLGSVQLGLQANGDRPEGESKAKYYAGFAMALAASTTYAVVLPLLELIYRKAKQKVTYTLVMEMQLVIGISATVFCAVSMAVNNDFQAISREAQQYGLGEANYYLVVVFNAVATQLFFIGLVGTISCASALFAGVVLASCIPATVLLSVIIFHDKFDGEKAVALALILWGAASYFYGEYTRNHQQTKGNAMETHDRLPLSVV